MIHRQHWYSNDDNRMKTIQHDTATTTIRRLRYHNKDTTATTIRRQYSDNDDTTTTIQRRNDTTRTTIRWQRYSNNDDTATMMIQRRQWYNDDDTVTTAIQRWRWYDDDDRTTMTIGRQRYDDKDKLGHTEVAAASPRRTWSSLSNDHVLSKSAKEEGKWNYSTRKFNQVMTLYVARPCSVCRVITRVYCSCDPGRDLCSVCYGLHVQEHGHWNNIDIN
jgi:hypothetical protein